MKNSNEGRRLRNARHHELRNATAGSGAIVGATLGMFAGPLGAVAGGLVGGLIGSLSGLVLEREVRRANAHDRQLDVDVGMTARDLGARDAASAGLTSTQRTSRRERKRVHHEFGSLVRELDHGAPAAEPVLEPPCTDCVDARFASHGSVFWCARHSHPPMARNHLHYAYPEPFALGSMLFRS